MYVSLERGLCLALSNLTHLCVSFFYRSGWTLWCSTQRLSLPGWCRPIVIAFLSLCECQRLRSRMDRGSSTPCSRGGKVGSLFHVSRNFYQKNGVMLITSGAIGNYYNANNLTRMTRQIGNEVKSPNAPLFEALSKVAFEYKDLLFEVVHSDAHKFCRRGCCPKSTIIEPTFAVITTWWFIRWKGLAVPWPCILGFPWTRASFSQWRCIKNGAWRPMRRNPLATPWLAIEKRSESMGLLAYQSTEKVRVYAPTAVGG